MNGAPETPDELPEGWHHRDATVNGVRLHFVVAGQGPLIVLLHGFPEFWYSWRHQIPVLSAAGWRVVALDQRGYNTSDKPEGVASYRIETLADDVACLIQELGERRAVVVGHDWGGAVAWTVAMRHPQRVRQLVVLNGPHPQRFMQELLHLSQLRKSWYMLFLQLPWLPECLLRFGGFRGLAEVLSRDPVRSDAFTAEDLAAYRRAISQPGALTAAINYYRALFRRNPLKLRRQFRRIETPTLLIWGERDRYLGVRLTEGLEPWVTHLTVERIADASHWVQVDACERVNVLLLAFLRLH